jgi:hypothetical protein
MLHIFLLSSFFPTDDAGNEQGFQFQPTAEDNQLLYSDMNTLSNRDRYQSSAREQRYYVA